MKNDLTTPLRSFGPDLGTRLKEISDIHRHFLNLRVVETLDVLQRAHGVRRYEIDRHTLAAEAPGPTDAVQVVL